jgi:heme/copper-type cytochrome/quinol oxidase subunit 4
MFYNNNCCYYFIYHLYMKTEKANYINICFTIITIIIIIIFIYRLLMANSITQINNIKAL